MDFDPDTYEKTSFDAILPAKKLIESIKAKNETNNKYTIVLDVGCGPGNTAKMLAEELQPEQVIGVDIDPEMVSFARTNNSMENNKYYTQDVSRHWDDWDVELKRLAGKVSVIFSNYALHWVQNSETTANNFAKLLSSNGIVVFDFLNVGDIYRLISPELRTEYEQWLRYPTEQEIIGRWITDLKNVGLTNIEMKYWEPISIYPIKVYDEFINIPIKWFKQYLNDQKVPKNVSVDDILKELILKERGRIMAEKCPKGDDLIEIRQHLWEFVVKK
ncbi:malonyl-[acyl-carrier protein] O-methyltransferase-like [Oppia nitens]|uniref:malonyl-[acyl-carrier protein] O-methyltransferase-like n=1 Tax=Oppia nitens TaxID=1686743 RepID=UPI0023DC3167|nr:malonyl-[acyl-carrier protein] O-methyltransferase-like [Oppia nitens]